jgi:recombination DNA repair RAD52 pathway protein
VTDDAIFWAQLEQLFRPVNPLRVKKLKGNSYLETWDVAAHLTRIFGPMNWNTEVLSCDLVFETERTSVSEHGEVAPTGKWDVCYRAVVRLTVQAGSAWQGPSLHEDVGTGTASNQPDRGSAHDQAVKTAVGDGLKRAARLLGNQFGLSLYDGGSVGTVVSSSLAHPNPFKQDEVAE